MSKVVFITGASNGIGKGLAEEFAKRGYQLALAARTMAALNNVKDSIVGQLPATKILCYQLDVTQSENVASVIEQAGKDFGRLDIVIANAGIGGGGTVGSGKLAQDISVIATNVIGAIATIDAAMARFKQQGSGQIVAISSVAAFRGMPGAASYCASKAALATYMQSLETETINTNIHTTTFFPGYIDTDINNMLKSRPFLISVAKAAPMMVNMIEKKVKRSTVPPYPWSFVGQVLKILPNRFFAGKKMA
jgi:hypothetical protein